MLLGKVFKGISAVLIISLTACEAKLDLDGVNETKKKTTMRHDQFQAASKSSDAIVIVGSRGVILNSQDHGKNWKRQILKGDSSTSLPTLIDVTVCPDNRFVALDATRKLWVSDKNGENWKSRPIGTEEEVTALTCDPQGVIWVVGSFTLIVKTEDFGASWIDKSIQEDAIFSRIQFIDKQHAIVTGEFGSIYITADGGETWKPSGLIPNEFYPMSSLFISLNEGWAGGLQGIIFHTKDGGLNWQRQSTGTVAPIYNIFPVGDKIFAAGEQGTLLVLQKDKWVSYTKSLGFGYLRAALQASDDKFLVAGGGGFIKLLRADLLSHKQINNN